MKLRTETLNFLLNRRKALFIHNASLRGNGNGNVPEIFATLKIFSYFFFCFFLFLFLFIYVYAHKSSPTPAILFSAKNQTPFQEGLRIKLEQTCSDILKSRPKEINLDYPDCGHNLRPKSACCFKWVISYFLTAWTLCLIFHKIPIKPTKNICYHSRFTSSISAILYFICP